MTRQHFQAIADTFRSNRPNDHWDANKRLQWDMDVNAMADVCRRFNAQFKRERFIDACGGLHNV
jgi:hypothetical protein